MTALCRHLLQYEIEYLSGVPSGLRNRRSRPLGRACEKSKFRPESRTSAQNPRLVAEIRVLLAGGRICTTAE
jgi:hypothetical protein